MKIAAVCIIVIAGIVSVAAAREAGIGPFAGSLPMSLQAPHGLSQAVASNGHPLAPGQWTHHGNIRFSVQSDPSNPQYRIQVELAQNGAAATNSPSATARTGSSVVVHGLGTGSYRWWARFFDGSAISPWVPFSSGPALKVDASPRAAPTITSTTDPVPGKVYKSGTVALSWTSTDAGSGIANYKYVFGPHGNGTPMVTTSTSLSMNGLGTGDYALTVMAKDRAGNWSPPATYKIRLDSTAPFICSTCYGFSSLVGFNPHYNPLTFNYRVNVPATIRIGIYNQSTNQRVRLAVRHSTAPNQLLHFVWHGRDDHGNMVPAGTYEYVVRTIDSYGNSSVSTYSGLQVLDKVIIVSLTQQRLWAYQDGKVVQTSLVTTGNVNCCATPVGLYTILEAKHPFQFVSPAPVGSFYHYAPSWVQYAMLFQNRGFYIHDAPWRTVFGPGTNTVPGVPGSPETGSHGCINTPLSMAQFLYRWAPLGTPVKVLN